MACGEQKPVGLTVLGLSNDEVLRVRRFNHGTGKPKRPTATAFFLPVLFLVALFARASKTKPNGLHPTNGRYVDFKG